MWVNKVKRCDYMKIIAVNLLFYVLTAWCFFDFALVSLMLILFFVFSLIRGIREKKREKIWLLNLAFKEGILYIRNGLAAGYSPEKSMQEALGGLEKLYLPQHPICREFRYMLSQMEMGISMEQAWLAFGERSGADDIRQFADVFSVVKRTGGNLGQVLKQTGDVIQGKIELKRDLLAMVAAKRTEFQIMSKVPYGIIVYLRVCAPSMVAGLYHNTFGSIFMLLVFFMYYCLREWGFWMIRREETV